MTDQTRIRTQAPLYIQSGALTTELSGAGIRTDLTATQQNVLLFESKDVIKVILCFGRYLAVQIKEYQKAL